MSSGRPKSTPVANPTTTQAAVGSGNSAADEAAAQKKYSLRGSSDSDGSSILTSGAGILDEMDLRKNTLGAGAYNRNTSGKLG